MRIHRAAVSSAWADVSATRDRVALSPVLLHFLGRGLRFYLPTPLGAWPPARGTVGLRSSHLSLPRKCNRTPSPSYGEPPPPSFRRKPESRAFGSSTRAESCVPRLAGAKSSSPLRRPLHKWRLLQRLYVVRHSRESWNLVPLQTNALDSCFRRNDGGGRLAAPTPSSLLRGKTEMGVSRARTTGLIAPIPTFPRRRGKGLLAASKPSTGRTAWN